MKRDILLYLERKMKGESDSRRGRNRSDYTESRYDREDSRGYPIEYRREDGRRAKAPRGDQYEEDYMDYEEDYHNYKHIKLTKADFSKWEKMLHNADGSHGPHYNHEQAVSVAEKLGIRFDSYSEREFHMCLNMMYADYFPVVAKHMPPERTMLFLAEMAKAFFDDPDGPEPSEKLALYFHCVVCSEE
jgi:hypothetical protein